MPPQAVMWLIAMVVRGGSGRGEGLGRGGMQPQVVKWLNAMVVWGEGRVHSQPLLRMTPLTPSLVQCTL